MMAEQEQPSVAAQETAPRPIRQMIIGGVVLPILIVLVLGGYVASIFLSATSEISVPNGRALVVHSRPDSAAPVVARYGAKQTLAVSGRTADWRWLEVQLWDDQRGWALRPLDIFVWRIKADVVTPSDEFNVTNVDPITAEMVAIPAGRFTMGSAPGLGQEDESPARTVELSAFRIDKTEVTVGQYWQCVIEEECPPPTADGMPGLPRYTLDPANDNRPIINVTWEAATTYCHWRDARLPTEAEWEKAAGWNSEIGARSLWPWGNDPAVAAANIGANAEAAPGEIGSFADDLSPNGVYDMGGNVREWVQDWYKVNYYAEGVNDDPPGPTYRRGEGTGHVVRGGAYEDDVDAGRTANRHHENPDYGRPTIGFRCAVSETQ